jgi:acyl-CoA reductase-like NAD-dependent aldehyde dehydrogenase
MDGDFAGGYFVALAIFVDVAEESDLAGNEIFGPVLSVMGFEAEEDAMRMANGSLYTLAAYIFTNDLRCARRPNVALEAGTVWINGIDAPEPSIPFGGCKQNSYGLGGRADMFMRPKNVWLPLGTAGRRTT